MYIFSVIKFRFFKLVKFFILTSLRRFMKPKCVHLCSIYHFFTFIQHVKIYKIKLQYRATKVFKLIKWEFRY